MFTLKQAVLLALAGTALAVPVAHRHRGDYEGPFGRVPGAQGWDATATATASDDGESIVVVYGGGQGSYQSGGDDTQSSSGSGAPALGSDTGSGSGSTDVGAGSSGSSGSDTGYMSIVNQYRTAGGLPAFSQSSKLEANAKKTAVDGNGQMVHQLNPGSMGQVLAPGGPSDFEHVYVGGWLCEIPSLPGLNGICASASQGWSHDGQTGHAKILTNTGYSQIGCANAGGIWACDCA